METATASDTSVRVRSDAFHNPDHFPEGTFQTGGERVGDPECEEQRQSNDAEPLPFGGGDTGFDAVEGSGYADESGRHVANRGEGDGHVDEVGIQRVAVTNADADSVLGGIDDFYPICMIVHVCWINMPPVRLGQNFARLIDEGDAQRELFLDGVENAGQFFRTGRFPKQQNRQTGFTFCRSDGFGNAFFLDRMADIQTRKDQRYHYYGKKAAEQADPER